jgi:hypothetical protein
VLSGFFLNPALLSDADYGKRNNPEPARFLAAHPDVAQNPDFISSATGREPAARKQAAWEPAACIETEAGRRILEAMPKTFRAIPASLLISCVFRPLDWRSTSGSLRASEKEFTMRADRPLIGAVLFLGCGLGLILGYCHGTTGFSAAYPFSGSTLHLDLTTVGPAVLGGVTCTAIGLLMLVWAFLAAIVSLFTWTERTRARERVVERYSVVPSSNGSDYAETPVVEERRHFWNRPSTRSNI